MALNCGIVGLPNVGKSTIFSALSSAPAEAANYPFCTINPNIGMVNVPDKRLDAIAAIFNPKRVIPATVEFVDIAGLVRGASKGEGLGNQFLANIRNVGCIVHVVRCFENPDIVHVDNRIDPASDIETISIELALADLDTVDKRIARTEKSLKGMDKNAAKTAQTLLDILSRVRVALSDGKPARSLNLPDDQAELLDDLHLMTMKPQIFLCNVDEAGMQGPNSFVEAVEAVRNGAPVLRVCGKLEAEIAALETEEDRAEFLAASGLEESGLVQLIRAAYAVLGLRTYFTAGPEEVRAWTFHDGDLAPRAAGVIHTDFEKGFIKAETYHFDDLMQYGTEQKLKEAGKLRMEGKEYRVKDGDLMHFRFNV